MSLRRRAATRGSTTPIRVPLLIAISRLPSGTSSTRSPGLTWASSRGAGEVGEVREAGLAGLLDEDAHRRLRARARRDRPLAGLHEEHLEPVDVALGDAVGRVEGEGLLVVLACGAQLAELPQGLREPVLGLRVRAELDEPSVRLCRLRPLGGVRVCDGLVDQLALEPRLARGRLGCGVDLGEGHGAVVLSVQRTPRGGSCRAGRRTGVESRARVSSIERPPRQTWTCGGAARRVRIGGADSRPPRRGRARRGGPPPTGSAARAGAPDRRHGARPTGRTRA